MAGGTIGTGWYDLIQDLTALFNDDQKRARFAVVFKKKHGKNGNGSDDGSAKPYKFGQFADQFGDDPQDRPLFRGDNSRGQFLLDSGTRHWDSSVELLELAIKQSLTRVKSDGTNWPKKIKFVSAADPNATKARAEIKVSTTAASGATSDQPLVTAEAINSAVASDDLVTITIVCPPANLRPRP
jgi:hypothetical protein